MKAADKGHSDIIVKLLHAKADVDMQNQVELYLLRILSVATLWSVRLTDTLQCTENLHRMAKSKSIKYNIISLNVST